jgi:hypothetical protein
MDPRRVNFADTLHDLFDVAPPLTRRLASSGQPGTRKVVPDPLTGQPLQVASIEHTDRTICPSCAQLGSGAYVSFVSDLRLAFACPNCRKLTFTAGT